MKGTGSTPARLPRLAVSSVSSYNTPPCEAAMAFTIRAYRRFPMQCIVPYSIIGG